MQGDAITSASPPYRLIRLEGTSLDLSIDHTQGGLFAKSGAHPGSTVAGKDRCWQWAKTSIVGRQVALTSTKASKPMTARYACPIDMMFNLCIEAGLPTVPIRTDDESTTSFITTPPETFFGLNPSLCLAI